MLCQAVCTPTPAGPALPAQPPGEQGPGRGQRRSSLQRGNLHVVASQAQLCRLCHGTLTPQPRGVMEATKYILVVVQGGHGDPLRAQPLVSAEANHLKTEQSTKEPIAPGGSEWCRAHRPCYADARKSNASDSLGAPTPWSQIRKPSYCLALSGQLMAFSLHSNAGQHFAPVPGA